MKFSWPETIKKSVSKHETPFYLFAWRPVLSALDELLVLNFDIPIKHWLSFKTQPVAPLIRNWKKLGNGIEVVSEYEFLAAIKENYRIDQILVNGVAKHNWLHKYDLEGIRVHFDSITETNKLLSKALKNSWRVGLRCHVSEEFDPDEPEYGGQFGMTIEESIQAISLLKKSKANIESLHFHLRSNVRSWDSYNLSINEVKNICEKADFSPTYLDIGGGFPVSGESTTDEPNSTKLLDLADVRQGLLELRQKFPNLKEVWFENGRFITSRSGVLVLKIIDLKIREDSRYLICDGGRTNHALVSDWEIHDFIMFPERGGQKIHTTVCGPTCMAFDRLLRADLPEDIQIGDYFIWMNAGAYHLPWETRFSKGLCKVLWFDENNEITIARNEEEFINWWQYWL